MLRKLKPSKHAKGQVLVLFALAFTAILLIVGVAIDGGYGLEQRRTAQNAADFAALGGARIIAESIGGNTVDGTDANVKAAIQTSLHVNGVAAPTFGSPNGPTYVDEAGEVVGWVGGGSIPNGAFGVRVSSSLSWRPFFLGIAGMNSLTASASATARGGYWEMTPGGVFPMGIAQAFFDGRDPCSGPISNDPSSPCYVQQLTPGNLNVPGGFGWLKFGCDGYGLGQVPPANNGGCGNNAGFLQSEINGASYGCCTKTGLPGSADKIGSLPGNKVSADCSSVVGSGEVVTIAVWDKAGGTGSNAWYHIVGFAGFQITGCFGAKSVTGVWRQRIFLGPTTSTPSFAGADLSVQLVH
jgi:Putative Flp pilus-assembly TadE/G-like